MLYALTVPSHLARTFPGVRASLVALARYDEAEAVLLDARRDLESLRPFRDADMKATVARLVDLYVAWGKPDAAATYRALLQS